MRSSIQFIAEKLQIGASQNTSSVGGELDFNQLTLATATSEESKRPTMKQVDPHQDQSLCIPS